MKRFNLLCSAAVLATAAAAQPAFAQAEGGAGSGDIIVTARRVEERLQDVPISITVFDQQQLTNRNVVNAGDLAIYTPSLTSNGRFGSENTSFAIRGFMQENGTAPSVAVYFADVAALRAAGGTTFGNGAGPGAFFDLQNVQVLKGSQGTLFGRNTTGGAVLLVPQKPTREFEGYVEGSIGNYDMHRLQAVLNIPVTETLRVRLGVDRQQRDGYLRNISGIGPKDFADTNYWAVRASIIADLTPDLENYTIGTFSDSDTNGFLPQVFTCAPTLSAGAAFQLAANLACAQIARRRDFYDVENATVEPRQHVRQWQAINTTTWRASDTLTIKNIISYGEFREFFRSSVYGENLLLPSGVNAGRSFIKSQSSPRPGALSAAESTFTEELQFQGRAFSERLKWQAGGYIEISKPIGDFTGSVTPNGAVCQTINSAQCTPSGIPALGNALVIGRLNKQSFDNYGIYGQATYDLTDQLSFTAGARYTWDSTRATTRQFLFASLPITTNPPLARCIVNALVNVPESSCQIAFKQKADKPTWLIDIDYKPTDDLLFYAKYARGYRAGGIKTDGGTAFATFGPEKVDTYEAGLKSSLRGPVPATFNITGFYSDFFNQQLAARLDPNPTGPLAGTSPPQVIASVGTSRIYGVEVEASVTPFSGVTIEGNYAYLNSKLKSVSQLAAGGAIYLPPVTSGTTVGQPLGYTPRNKFSITGNYTLPLDASVGKITIGATFSHSDSLLSSAGYIIPITAPTTANPNPVIPINVIGSNLARLPGLDLLNLNASWTSVAGKPLDLAFFMTNATNKKYSAAVFGGIGAFGYDSRALGEPRTFGFRAKVHF